MEFDANSDQDFLHELFGEDTLSLFEYVSPTHIHIHIHLLIIYSAIQRRSMGVRPRT